MSDTLASVKNIKGWVKSLELKIGCRIAQENVKILQALSHPSMTQSSLITHLEQIL